MKTRYANVTVSADRHGKLRARWRKAGHDQVYLKTLPDQPGFEAELKAIAADKPIRDPRVVPRSINDLAARYYRSADFAAKGGADDKRRRRSIIEGFRQEYGNDMVADFSFEHIEAILIRKTEKRTNEKGRVVGGQVAATILRKQLRRLFALARKLEWIAGNPVEDADQVGQRKLSGFYSWTEADIAAYQQRHSIGSKARLALEIILWTGQRRGDARLFGPTHIVGGKINFQAGKNGADLWMPVARDLRRAIDATPSVGIRTFIVTEYGKTFTKDGFGNKFREWCDEAGLPQCTAHGLRKAISRRMAQTQGTDAEMMAVGGWKQSGEVRIYTEAVEQEALAKGIIDRIDQRYSTDGDTP